MSENKYYLKVYKYIPKNDTTYDCSIDLLIRKSL